MYIRVLSRPEGGTCSLLNERENVVKTESQGFVRCRRVSVIDAQPGSSISLLFPGIKAQSARENAIFVPVKYFDAFVKDNLIIMVLAKFFLSTYDAFTNQLSFLNISKIVTYL